MTTQRDIVVVGGGVFGATAALELARRGWRVRLVDRGPVPHADASSTDISKMVRMDYGADVFYHELAEAALEGWEGWNQDWPRPLYHPEGFLVLSTGPMRPWGFEYESHRILRERGYSPERVDAATLERRFPKWSAQRYPDGYVSPRGGWAESGAVVARLAELCREAGVEVIEATVSRLTTEGSDVTGVQVGRFPGASQGGESGHATPGAGIETLTADHVLVCAGAWTPVLLPETSVLLTPVAQPVLHFGVEDPDAYRGPSFPPFAADIAGSGWYGFPALPDGRLKLGHHGPGRVATPDGRGEVDESHVKSARAFLADAIPSLADAPLVGSRVCMYCDSRDGDLLVDRLPGADNATVAAGGSGHGFKFAPVLGGIIADAVEGRESRWLSRFAWRTPASNRKEEARLLIPKEEEE